MSKGVLWSPLLSSLIWDRDVYSTVKYENVELSASIFYLTLQVCHFPSLFFSVYRAHELYGSTGTGPMGARGEGVLQLDSTPSSYGKGTGDFTASPLLEGQNLHSATSCFTSSGKLGHVIP